MSTSAGSVVSVEFEVFGKVQGVFFRKHTQEQGKRLGLRGWCMNTDRGTVQGVLEGEPRPVAAMKRWLRQTGSPKSRIEKAVFNSEKVMDKFTFKEFSIRR